MDATLREVDLKIWGPYRNYQDEARLQYGRLMWCIPEMRECLLQHWLDERHPWHERFAKNQKSIEEVLTSSLTLEELNNQLLSKEPPSAVWRARFRLCSEVFSNRQADGTAADR